MAEDGLNAAVAFDSELVSRTAGDILQNIYGVQGQSDTADELFGNTPEGDFNAA